MGRNASRSNQRTIHPSAQQADGPLQPAPRGLFFGPSHPSRIERISLRGSCVHPAVVRTPKAGRQMLILFHANFQTPLRKLPLPTWRLWH